MRTDLDSAPPSVEVSLLLTSGGYLMLINNLSKVNQLTSGYHPNKWHSNTSLSVVVQELRTSVSKRRHGRGGALIGKARRATALAMCFIMAGSPCFAAIALPHRYSITWISGGSDGVNSDLFRLPSGTFCISYYFKVRTKTVAGNTPDLGYTMRLYENKFLGGAVVRTKAALASASMTTYSGSRACWSGLSAGPDYYVNWSKNEFDTGTLEGAGELSAS